MKRADVASARMICVHLYHVLVRCGESKVKQMKSYVDTRRTFGWSWTIRGKKSCPVISSSVQTEN